jgi:hypothetical protein
MPAAEAPRHALQKALKPLCPRRWKFIPYQRNLDTLSTTVVMLKQNDFEALPAAPHSTLLVGFTVTIVTPLTDPEKAEDALDDDVVALLHAMDAAGFAWTKATKVLFDDAHLAYDIDLTITTEKKVATS